MLVWCASGHYEIHTRTENIHVRRVYKTQEFRGVLRGLYTKVSWCQDSQEVSGPEISGKISYYRLVTGWNTWSRQTAEQRPYTDTNQRQNFAPCRWAVSKIKWTSYQSSNAQCKGKFTENSRLNELTGDVMWLIRFQQIVDNKAAAGPVMSWYTKQR
jgi:hypothetical protein